MRVVLGLLASQTAFGATFTVGPGPAADFHSIQAAVDAAGPADTIEVEAGIYAEAVDLGNKGIVLRGMDGAEATFIDAGGAAAFAVRLASTVGTDVTLEGFTLLNAGQQGLWIDSASPTVQDVVFQSLGNDLVAGGAVAVQYGNPRFIDCTFDSSVASSGGAIHGTQAGLWIEGGSFTGNFAGSGGAIYLDGGSLNADSAYFGFNEGFAGGGAVFVIDADSIDVVDVDFDDNGAPVGWGGAVLAERVPLVTVTGGSAYGNRAGFDGGAWYVGYAESLTVDGGSYTLNDAAAGGAFGIDGTPAILSNVVLDDNVATNGGGINSYRGSLTLDGCELSGNYSSLYGGGVYTVETAPVEFTGTTFEGNEGYYGGAGELDSSAVTIDDCTFNGNIGWYSGGAIYSWYSTFELTNSAFSGNGDGYYYGYGGAVRIDGSVATIADTSFTGNYVYGGGGAIYTQWMDSALRLERCTFTGNTAGYGGAFVNDYCDAYVEEGTFDGNSVSGYGGAISSYGGDVEAVDSLFDGNVAEADQGGAIRLAGDWYYGGALTLTNTSFVGNRAEQQDGGAVFASFPTWVQITGCSFDDNEAGGDGAGGALCMMDAGPVGVYGSTFTGNRAEYGGGAYAWWPTGFGSSDWANDVFLGNSAAYGGGIALVGDGLTDLTNLSVVANEGRAEGGGLYAWEHGVDLRNTVVAYSLAGGGAFVGDDLASSGLVAKYNDWFDNGGGDLNEGDPMQEGSLAVAPDFARFDLSEDWSEALLILAADSPLIDAGDPDIDDADGTRSDIGAYGGPDVELVDADGDGFYSVHDCDDDDAAVHPGADEVWYDGVDQDCLGGSDYDQDEDGADSSDFGGTDCDDLDAAVIDDCGTPPDGEDPDGDEKGGAGKDDGSMKGGCGCAAGGGATPGWLALGLVVLAGRRRSTRQRS